MPPFISKEPGLTESDAAGRISPKIAAAGSHSTRTIEARVHAVGSSGLRTISIRGFRLNSGEGAHVAGFDLGPGPDEHFLGALGASLAQSVSNVCCSHGLHVDRIDVTAAAVISLEPSPGQFVKIETNLRIESGNPPAAFDGITTDIMANSSIASAIHVPIELTLAIVPLDPNRLDAVDWQI